MGYIKIIESGDYLEVYKYSKNYVNSKRSKNTKRKRRSQEAYFGNSILSTRSSSSIKRAKKAFFRLVSSNLQGTENPAFVTLTVIEEVDVSVAYLFLKEFVRKLRKVKGDGVRYIATPEWQPVSGRIHFHCLFWGLQEEDTKKADFDRDRRNYQRQWLRGYVDVRFAADTNLAIAGYMAKYMAKASEDKRLRNIRAYSFSRNCRRAVSTASNNLDIYLDMISGEDGVDNQVVKVSSYDTVWLGRCDYQQIKRQ